MKNPEKLVFNPFGVNTYIIPAGGGSCAIVDAACFGASEEKELADTILSNGLSPKALITTHFHVDHIAGNPFVTKQYGLKTQTHPDFEMLWPNVGRTAVVFGFAIGDLPKPEIMLAAGDFVTIGDLQLQVRHTPGHAAGSICLVNHAERYVLTGDVLFRDSIGRTDLFSGDFDLLMQSIKEQLFTLPDDYVVYPGHGPETTIGYEKLNNPFIN